MLDFTRERPALFPAEEFDRFDRQIHRYAALARIPRITRSAVSSWSKSCGRRSRRRPTEIFTHSRCSR
jgi:hypothetical protein